MSEKYRQEIEEILRQADEVLSQEGTEPAPPVAPKKRYVLRLPRLGSIGLPQISPGKVMLAAFALFIMAIVLRATTGPVMLFVWLGLALFVVAYAMFFARPGNPSLEKRWRGRLMEEQPTDLWARFKRWMRG